MGQKVYRRSRKFVRAQSPCRSSSDALDYRCMRCGSRMCFRCRLGHDDKTCPGGAPVHRFEVA